MKRAMVDIYASDWTAVGVAIVSMVKEVTRNVREHFTAERGIGTAAGWLADHLITKDCLFEKLDDVTGLNDKVLLESLKYSIR